MPDLTHFDADGRPRMVDVSAKAETAREATATGRLTMKPETLTLVRAGQAAKGDVRAAAEIAGVMAAKRTSDLIPLCHPLPLSAVAVAITDAEDGAGLVVTATVRTRGPTGVEMEALTATSVALLTLYDMLKAADRGMTIQNIGLVSKSGGASGDWVRA